MKLPARFRRVLRRVFGRRLRGDEMLEEMQAHVEFEAESLIEVGVAEREARRRARLAFGSMDRFREEAWDTRRARWLEMIARDARLGVRTLARMPGFTAIAVLTLALGIGATTSVFTVVNGVLLRPLPYASPDQLALIWTVGASVDAAADELPLSAANYLDVRERVTTFVDLAAFRARTYGMTEAAGARRVEGAGVAASLFAVLGVRPLLGRTFTADDDRTGAPRVAVVSHELWQSRWGGAVDVIGETIELDGDRYTVIGVMPPGFTFPRGAELPSGFGFPNRTAVWTPLAWTEGEAHNRGNQNLAVVGRLEAGVSLAAARDELRSVAASLRAVFPPFAQGGSFTAVSMQQDAAASVRGRLLLLLGVAVFVMLIACVNVAHLILVRSLARERELSVRAALGAGPARVGLQVVTEGLVMSGIATLAALGVSMGGTRFMLALVPGQLPRADDVTLDTTVLAVTLAVAAGIGLLFGIVSLMHFDRSRLAASLQATGSRGSTARGGAVRRVFLAVEVALALILLVGATLLTTSLVNVHRVAPGFEHRNVMVADLLVPFAPGFDQVGEGPHWVATFTALLDRLAAYPGVEVVGGTSALPLSGGVESTSFGIAGADAAPDAQPPIAEFAVVTAGYFDALRIPLMRGRGFTEHDRADAPLVVIINEALAEQYFPGENPIGRRLLTGLRRRDAWEIIGVAANVRGQGLDAEVRPALFWPMRQMPYPFLTIAVRTRAGLAAEPQLFREALRAIDPTLMWGEIRPLRAVVNDSLAQRRFSALLVGVFAAVALLLTVVGLYGAIAFTASQRTRELGVRVALGATRNDVLRLVLSDGARPVAVGVGAGLIGAYFLTKLLRNQLYQISPTDARVYFAAALMLGIVALVATLVPARRAAHSDPVRALREG